MSGTRPDQSKLYHRKMSATWWLKKPSYFFFMLRELSSVFITIFLVVFLVQLYQLTRGPMGYAAFVYKLSSPRWLAFKIVTSLFVFYHSISWFDSFVIVLPIAI